MKKLTLIILALSFSIPAWSDERIEVNRKEYEEFIDTLIGAIERGQVEVRERNDREERRRAARESVKEEKPTRGDLGL